MATMTATLYCVWQPGNNWGRRLVGVDKGDPFVKTRASRPYPDYSPPPTLTNS
jgi:hypothetical protein